uniref:Transmembrane protein 204 n=1 Tax=Astyanax mexicanus TaxID=7994 RepID=A0A3B1JZQ1_ASTMX
MAVGRLVLVAVALALASLLLNATAALGSGWVLQALEDGRRRSVGLWRVCLHSSDAEVGTQAQPRPHPPCQALGWGADLSGYQESRSTVKLQFDMMRACNLMATVALTVGQLIFLLGLLKIKHFTQDSQWWEEAIAALFQLATPATQTIQGTLPVLGMLLLLALATNILTIINKASLGRSLAGADRRTRGRPDGSDWPLGVFPTPTDRRTDLAARKRQKRGVELSRAY